MKKNSEPIDSYDMTPLRPIIPASDTNYNIDDLQSGDETDDEDEPRKPVRQVRSYDAGMLRVYRYLCGRKVSRSRMRSFGKRTYLMSDDRSRYSVSHGRCNWIRYVCIKLSTLTLVEHYTLARRYFAAIVYAARVRIRSAPRQRSGMHRRTRWKKCAPDSTTSDTRIQQRLYSTFSPFLNSRLSSNFLRFSCRMAASSRPCHYSTI